MNPYTIILIMQVALLILLLTLLYNTLRICTGCPKPCKPWKLTPLKKEKKPQRNFQVYTLNRFDPSADDSEVMIPFNGKWVEVVDERKKFR